MVTSSTTNPLLLLLQGVLSQEEENATLAMARLDAETKIPISSFLVKTPKLLLSCKDSLERVVSYLVVHKPSWARIPSQLDGSLPLHFAASIGNLPLATVIFNAFPTAALTANQKGKIPVHYAAREGHDDVVEFFTKRMPEMAAVRSKAGLLALHYAVVKGHSNMVRSLLKAYPEGVKVPSRNGKLPIHLAARSGNIPIASDLLDTIPEDAYVSLVDAEGCSPLHEAAMAGQFEMMKFLVERHPEGLKQQDIPGEIPLFPAIRSGSLELIKFMIHAWPEGGRLVLQTVKTDDHVSEWNPAILELCLRGAVNIREHSHGDCDVPATRKDVPKQRMQDSLLLNEGSAASASATSLDETVTTARSLMSLQAAVSKACRNKSDSFDSSDIRQVSSAEFDEPLRPSRLVARVAKQKRPSIRTLEISPDDTSRPQKKRARHENTRPEGTRKRARLLERQDSFSVWVETANHKDFYELHAALECGASAPVLECILDRYAGTQIMAIDELGRMPLHVAMEFYSTNPLPEVVDLILERIWKANEAACSHRDFLGRLPLHHAIQNRADAKLIKDLLSSNPSSGVEYCDVSDEEFMDMLPIEMGIAFDCDVSTIYMLLRGDPSVVTTWPGTVML